MAGTLRTIVRNSLLIGGGLILGNVCSLLFRLIVARVYGPSSFGVFSIGFMLVSVTTTVAVLGLPAAVTQFVSKYRSNGREHRIPTVFLVSIVTSLALSIIFAGGLIVFGQRLAVEVFNSPRSADFIRWFAYLIPAKALVLLTAAFALGYEKGGIQIGVREVAPKVLVLCFTLGVVAVGGTIIHVGIGYVLAQWLAATLGVVASIIILTNTAISNITFPNPTSEARELLMFSTPLLLTTFTGFFLNWVDTFFVAYYLSDASVGIYQVAFLLGSSLSIFFTAIGRSLFPNFSALLAEGDISTAAHRYINGTRWALIISAAPFFYLVTFPREALVTIFGAEYHQGALPLIIILCGQFLAISCGPCTETVKSKGHNKFILLTYLVAVVVNIVANAILIPVIGLVGAAIGTSTAMFSQALLLFVRSRAILSLKVPWSELTKTVLAGAFTSLIFYFSELSFDTILMFFGSIVSFSIVYLFLSIALGGIKRRELLSIASSMR